MNIASFPKGWGSRLTLLIALPLIAMACRAEATPPGEIMDGLGVLNWVVVNDTVMGGRSEARLKWVTARGLVWSGNLSLENNGGFVSIRTRDAWFDWSQYDGVEVELEGSGRDVQVTLQRKDLRMRGGGYWAMLPTSEAGRTRAFIPFSAFDLKRFGRSVNGPALREGLGAIGEVGLLIADKKPGAFEVVLHKVTPVRLGPDHRTSPEVASAIIGAIERGAPIFNRGDTQGCAKLYRETLEGLLEGPSLGQASWGRHRISGALHHAQTEADAEAAWTMRNAMDDILRSMKR